MGGWTTHRIDTAQTSSATSPVDLIRGTDGFEWPVENLAVRRKSQTDLAGNQVNCLYKSRSLSHRIGLAEGTRPQPIPYRDQNHLAAFTIFLSATGALK